MGNRELLRQKQCKESVSEQSDKQEGKALSLLAFDETRFAKHVLSNDT